MGTRGIPANYSGFETLAEELGTRLAERGHVVTVYCRPHVVDYSGREYRGVRLVFLPSVRTKYLDTVTHTLLSVLHACRGQYDVVLMCNAANAAMISVLRLTGTPTVLNVDGIERLRKKWGPAGKLWYAVGEYLATMLPHKIVTDAKVIEEYYAERWHAPSVMIPYGADPTIAESTRALERLGLKSRSYALVVTRLEPENNPDFVMRAYRGVETSLPLVIVGGAHYSAEYGRLLKEIASQDARIIMAGFIFGEGYRELISHAACFVQATEVGGTHPALVEAMAVANCVIANGTIENLEVVGDTALVYEPGDMQALTRNLQTALDDPALAREMGSRAARRAGEKYTWDAVTDAYEACLQVVVDKSDHS
jgi:glycosyltransferase involved in cell wall biosynthesis